MLHLNDLLQWKDVTRYLRTSLKYNPYIKPTGWILETNILPGTYKILTTQPDKDKMWLHEIR